MIDNENSSNLSADSLQAPQIQIVWGFLSRKTSWFLSLGISSIICVIEIDFIVPFNFYSISIFFQFAGEGATGREQPQGRKVTLAGPKSDIGRAEKSHKGQNVTLECYNKYYNTPMWHFGAPS